MAIGRCPCEYDMFLGNCGLGTLHVVLSIIYLYFPEKPIYNISEIVIVNVSIAYLYKLIGNT